MEELLKALLGLSNTLAELQKELEAKAGQEDWQPMPLKRLSWCECGSPEPRHESKATLGTIFEVDVNHPCMGKSSCPQCGKVHHRIVVDVRIPGSGRIETAPLELFMPNN